MTQQSTQSVNTRVEVLAPNAELRHQVEDLARKEEEFASRVERELE
jgi:hypothetical protein